MDHSSLVPVAKNMLIRVVNPVDEPFHAEPVNDPADATAAEREDVVDAERRSTQVEMVRAENADRSQSQGVGVA